MRKIPEVVWDVLVILAVLTVGALGSPPKGVRLDPAIHDWFEHQHNVITGESCCGNADGHILNAKQWRASGDAVEVLIDGVWSPVPPDTILKNAANPTGGAVVWYSEYQPHSIYCFVYPAMG